MKKEYNSIRNLRSFSLGISFILATLRQIEYAKDMYILDIEQGIEVYIPSELNQNDLPQSMRYYDPIIRIIYSRMLSSKKEYYNLRNSMNLAILQRDNLELQFKKKIGLAPG